MALKLRLVGGSIELCCHGKSVHFDPVRRNVSAAIAFFSSRLPLVLCLVVTAYYVNVPPEASAQSAAQSHEIWFDIPSQPLASALDAFSVSTGFVAVYDGNLAVGRLSSDIKGRLTPQAALPLLLQASGLVAQFTTPDAFVVIPGLPHAATERTPMSIAAAALSQQNPAEQRYSGMVQASINQSLCARPETRPGAYRLAISFRIGSSGEVAQLRLLGSTGDHERDLAITDVVGRASIGEPPPPRMAQPFTMVVLPRSSGGNIECPLAQGGGPRG